MGAEVVIPLLASAVGAGANVVNTRRVNNQQDDILRASLTRDRGRQDQANALVNTQVQRTGASNPDAEREASLDQFLTQLRRTQGQATQGLNTAGAVSDRYTEGAQAAAADVGAYGRQTADILSRVDAPGYQRQREGIEFSRLGNELGGVRQASDSDRYLTDLRMRGVRRDPWLDAFGAAASGYGASGGGSTSAAAANPTAGISNDYWRAAMSGFGG